MGQVLENIKQYLSQYRNIRLMVDAKREHIKDIQAYIGIISPDLTRDRIQSPKSDTVANAAIRLAEAKRELESDIKKLVDILHEITFLINSVNDLSLRTILFERYINLKKWDEIAKILRYSTRQTIRLHKKALYILAARFQSEKDLYESS